MPDVKLNIKSTATGTSQIEGLTGAMVKAQLATQAIIVAAKELVRIGTESVNKFVAQEKAEIALNSALKITGEYTKATSKELQRLASDLQNTTEYGDEASLSALALTQQLADLNENQLKQILPRLQDFSAALGVDLNTTASLVGKTLGSTTNALARYGIEIDTGLSKSEKFEQLIGALDSKFGGFAQSVGQSTGGELAQLNNAIGDLDESFGELIIDLLPAIDSVTEFVKGVDSIVKSIAKIDTKSIEVYSGILEKMVADGHSVDEALEGIALMTGKSKDKAVELYLVNEDLKKTYQEQKDILENQLSLHDAIFGKISAYFEEQKRQQEEAIQDAATQAENYAKAIDDIETKLEEIEQKGTFANVLGEDFDIMSEKGKALEDVIVSLIENGYKIEDDMIQDLLEKYDDIIQANKDFSDAMGETSKAAGDMAGQLKERMGEVVKSMGAAGAVGEIEKDWKEMFRNIAGYAMEFAGEVSDVIGLISNIVSLNYQNQIDEVERSLNEQLNLIDEWVQSQLELYGVAEETKQEQLQREIEELENKIATETDANEKQKLEEQKKEKEDALIRQQIYDEAEQKRQQAEQEAAMKKWKLEVQAFKSEQKAKKAQSWIDYGVGITAAAARAAGMGFILGPIYFAVMSAFMSAKHGLTLGYINQQKPPEAPTFAEGGIVSGNSYYGDKIMAYLNSGELVANQAHQKKLYEGLTSGDMNFYGNINLPGVKDADQFIDRMKEIQRREKVLR